MRANSLKKALEEANQKLKRAREVEKSLVKANKKALELEAKVERLKIKVLEAKNIGMVEFKDSEAYKSHLTKTTTIFLTKKKIKMERLVQRHHQIEDMSFLAHITDEPTFSKVEDDEVKEEGE